MLQGANKPMKDFARWNALDEFMMSKTEDIGGMLEITEVTFRITEVNEEYIRRSRDIKKISHLFAIPEKELWKALQ